MSQTHKLVRDAIQSAMQDRTTGFNAQLAAILPSYGITESVALDWQSGKAVGFGQSWEGDARLSTLKGRLILDIAPDGTQALNDTKGVKWSGFVGALLWFRIRYSASMGDDGPPPDGELFNLAAAVEDAVGEVFCQRGIDGWLGRGLSRAKRPDCPAYVFEELEDGCQVQIPIRLTFRVDSYYD